MSTLNPNEREIALAAIHRLHASSTETYLELRRFIAIVAGAQEYVRTCEATRTPLSSPRLLAILEGAGVEQMIEKLDRACRDRAQVRS